MYDDDSRELGTIRGFDERGFIVTLDDGPTELSIEHVPSGHESGEAELMWRCWQCGEMGRPDEAVSDGCPTRDAPREDLFYWTED